MPYLALHVVSFYFEVLLTNKLKAIQGFDTISLKTQIGITIETKKWANMDP
jgi:hypothetical protein